MARSSTPSSQAAARRDGGSGASDILTSIGEAVYEWSLADDVLRWGRNALAVLGVASFEAIASGRRYAALLDADNLTTPFDAVVNSADRDAGPGVPYQIEYALAPGATGAGERVWIEDTGRWFAGADGRPERAHGVVRVVTARHGREEKRARLGRFDALTGLMSRGELLGALEAAVETSVRQRTSSAFLVISLEDLGAVNEAYGFAAADRVIAKVAARIRGRLRGGDALGRFSGSKFGVVLMNCSRDDIDVAAGRFLEAIGEEVITTEDGPLAPSVTAGGVCIPAQAQSAGEALTSAQEALGMARAGGGGFRCYERSSERVAVRRSTLDMASEIVGALNENRLRLAFQPVVSAQDRTVAFHECLMRLERRDGTVVPAAEVMPAAEKLGLVRLIDHRVLTLALAELGSAQGPRLSVNVSPQTAARSDWLATLKAGLARLPDSARKRLTVEIGERAAVDRPAGTARFVAGLRGLGVRVALDDFGGGCTALRDVRSLCFDLVKIDGSFLENLSRKPDDRPVVKALVELAGALAPETVAKWVSDEETARLLAAMGATFLQGNHLAAAGLARPWGEPAGRPGRFVA